MEEDADLKAAVQQYLVHVKGALYRRTPYILALFGSGVGLFDAHTGRATQMWRFAEDGITVSAVPGEVDDLAVTVRAKASGMQRIMGKTEAESKWVVTCAGNRSDIIMRVLSMREVALGDVPEPIIYMGSYRPAAGVQTSNTQLQAVQLMVGSHSLMVTSATDGEALQNLTVYGMQRVRRLGDVPNGFAVRHQHQWHVLICDERNTVMTHLREKCDLLGLSSDIIFGCSVPLGQVERESSNENRLRAGAIESWPVLLQPPPKPTAAAAGWRNASARKRTLMLTPHHLLECDPDDSRVLWAREVGSVRGLRRWLEEPQRFTVEFSDGFLATYDSPHRDLIVALVAASLVSPGDAPQLPTGADLAAAAADDAAAAPSSGAAATGSSSAGDCPPAPSSSQVDARIGLSDTPARSRLLPPSAPSESCALAEQIVTRRLAAFVDAGVLPGGDDEDVLNPLVVAAAADVCANCFGNVLSFEGREVETALVALMKQLQGRKTLDRGVPGDMVSILECLQLLAGTRTGWIMLAKGEGRREECRAGLASVMTGLSSHHDEILLAALGVMRALASPPWTDLGKASALAPAGSGVKKLPAEVQKHMEALREEMLPEAACASLAQAVARRSAGDGGAGVLIVWEVLRLWQVVVCDLGKSLSSARLQAACTSSVLADNRVVTELLGHRCRPVSAAEWQIDSLLVKCSLLLVKYSLLALGPPPAVAGAAPCLPQRGGFFTRWSTPKWTRAFSYAYSTLPCVTAPCWYTSTLRASERE